MDLEVIVGGIQPTEKNDVWAINLVATVTNDQLKEIIELKKKGYLDIFVKGSD